MVQLVSQVLNRSTTTQAPTREARLNQSNETVTVAGKERGGRKAVTGSEGLRPVDGHPLESTGPPLTFSSDSEDVSDLRFGLSLSLRGPREESDSSEVHAVAASSTIRPLTELTLLGEA